MAEERALQRASNESVLEVKEPQASMIGTKITRRVRKGGQIDNPSS